jgi:hypothetical protein
MNCDLYAYAVGRIAGDVVPDTSDEFARCAVCGLHGSCDDVRVVCFADMPDAGCVGRVWRVCDSCQYAAVYGCSCQDCGFCRAVDVPLFQHSNGVIEAGRRDCEGVEGN